MNKQDQMTMQEAERKMESLREVFQVVRLVDGKMLMDREKRINAGDLSETCQCYSFWKKDKECENCSSLLALKEQTQKIKFEFLDLQVFQVISRYVEIDGRPYVMEMIQNLDESAKRTMTYESLMNRIMDYFYDTEIIAMSKVMAYNVWKTMQEVCKENLEKLKSPFFTTKTRGTGLGVYLCNEIMEAHGGNIRYFSKENKGTKVVITLPYKKKDIKNFS